MSDIYYYKNKIYLSAAGIEAILAKEGNIENVKLHKQECILKYKGEEYVTHISELSKTNKLIKIAPVQLLRARTIRKIWSKYNKEKTK